MSLPNEYPTQHNSSDPIREGFAPAAGLLLTAVLAAGCSPRTPDQLVPTTISHENVCAQPEAQPSFLGDKDALAQVPPEYYKKTKDGLIAVVEAGTINTTEGIRPVVITIAEGVGDPFKRQLVGIVEGNRQLVCAISKYGTRINVRVSPDGQEKVETSEDLNEIDLTFADAGTPSRLFTTMEKTGFIVDHELRHIILGAWEEAARNGNTAVGQRLDRLDDLYVAELNDAAEQYRALHGEEAIPTLLAMRDKAAKDGNKVVADIVEKFMVQLHTRDGLKGLSMDTSHRLRDRAIFNSIKGMLATFGEKLSGKTMSADDFEDLYGKIKQYSAFTDEVDSVYLDTMRDRFAVADDGRAILGESKALAGPVRMYYEWVACMMNIMRNDRAKLADGIQGQPPASRQRYTEAMSILDQLSGMVWPELQQASSK